MSAYKFIEPQIGVPGISATVTGGTTGTQTPPPLPNGFIAAAVDPTFGYAEFMFVQGAAASTPTAGDFCVVSGGSAIQAVSGATATQGMVGVAPAALSATNVFGWVQVYGICDYAHLATAASGAAGAPLFIGTTAGRAQTTASAAGFRIDGAYVSQYSTTANSNSGIVQLFYPSFNGR